MATKDTPFTMQFAGLCEAGGMIRVVLRRAFFTIFSHLFLNLVLGTKSTQYHSCAKWLVNLLSCATVLSS